MNTPQIPDWTQSEIERRALVESGGTVVCNLHKGVDQNLWAWAVKQDRYVACERKSNSFWQNRFPQDPRLADTDRDFVCDKFRDALRSSPEMIKRLPELSGKVLGCWCHPKRCHCDEIVLLMRERGLISTIGKYDSIPAELKGLPRWVLWRFVQMGERKTKVPFQRSGARASSTDPSTWCSFEQAAQAQGFDGIGFVFCKDDDICGIDLDHHRGADGQLDAFAVDVLKRLDSYAEFSPSGEGIHIILRGDIPKGRKDSARGLEAYPTGRYFTFTGKHVPGTPITVEKRHDAVAKFYAEFFPEKQADLPKANGIDHALKTTRATNLDDATLLSKARSAKDGGKFTRLWAGDSSDYGGDQSRADAGLLSILRFWTCADKARAFALFGQSGLADAKWQRPDYQERTWDVINSGEVYDPLHCEVFAPDDPEKLTEFDYANLLANRLPPIRTCEDVWYVYEAGVWRQTSRAIFRPVAQSVLPQAIRTARREMELLKHLEGRYQTGTELFKGVYSFAADGAVLINTANGVLEVHPDRIQLLPHSTDHNFTRATDAAFNPSATAPLYERALAEALPDPDDQDLFRLCLGNFLLPSAKHEVTLVCHGEGGRGKGTAAEPVAQVLGKSLVARLSLSQICDPKSYSLPQLRFASVNLGSELAGTDIVESDNFTKLVSGEAIDAREIYGKPGSMESCCKLWFLANRLPRFKSGTEAELRRTRFLRFDHKPPVVDVTLKDRIFAEQEGVFLLMLRGLQALLERGEIPQGGAHSREVHDRFRLSNDPVGTFVAQKCRLGFDLEVDKDRLKDSYDEFLRACQMPTACSEWFFRGLCERFTSITETKIRQGDSRVRRMRGIALQRETLEIDY